MNGEKYFASSFIFTFKKKNYNHPWIFRHHHTAYCKPMPACKPYFLTQAWDNPPFIYWTEGVMVIIVGNGIGNLGSEPGWGCFWFNSC